MGLLLDIGVVKDQDAPYLVPKVQDQNQSAESHALLVFHSAKSSSNYKGTRKLCVVLFWAVDPRVVIELLQTVDSTKLSGNFSCSTRAPAE